MANIRTLILVAEVFVGISGLLITTTPAFARETETVLYSFCSTKGCVDGENPGGLVFDASGNLYGATESGGAYGYGTVFELTPGANDTWTETVLYNFMGGTDASGPVANLIFDVTGSVLYGVSEDGGAHGYGTVFELTRAQNGTWTEQVLHGFNRNGKDGASPTSGLILDAAGNLYGTTVYGGIYSKNCNTYGCGTVFELTPGADGKWTEKILHSFKNNGYDGSNPWGGLTFDTTGRLYGTTMEGGPFTYGTVFRLAPRKNGKWTEILLHKFSNNGTDGVEPIASLIFDATGRLYGTTVGGGVYDRGTAFELLPTKNGEWREKVLHTFDPNGKDGVDPQSALVFDASGNLYGTTAGGGVNGSECGGYGCGTIFELTPTSNGTWTEKVLYSFCSLSGCTDGSDPASSLIPDASGNLYSTTFKGGADPSNCSGFGCGAVFKIVP